MAATRKPYARRGTSVRALPSGRHQARWYDDTGARHTRTFARKSDAATFLRNTVVDIERGEWIRPDKAAQTFSAIADDWLDTLALQRPKTVAGYRGILEKHLRPYFGSTPVSALRPTDIRKWLAAMHRAGKAPGTVRNAYRVLTPILDRAVEDGCIKASPAAPLRRKDLPASRPTEMLFLTAQQS